MLIINKFYSEICCDLCGEVIHNHFDCPVCKKQYAGTDIYYDMYKEFNSFNTLEFHCEECNTKFKLVGDFKYYEPTAWEIVN